MPPQEAVFPIPMSSLKDGTAMVLKKQQGVEVIGLVELLE